jgi:uncharacterized protein (TIGR03437 family)
VADSFSYELSFGTRMPPQSGPGVFINPQGVLNAASFAVGYPISPGGFLTLFGTGFGSQTATASGLPIPFTLAGVSATINSRAAPIYQVLPGQISLIVPYGVTGKTATIVVTVGGTASNAVEVPLAATAPGLLSLAQNGLGDAAVLHQDYSVVNAASPALPGEIVQVFLTGMGAVTPSAIEGVAAPSAPPATANAATAVTIGGLDAQIFFNGLAPQLASLYQLNVRVPTGLAAGAHSLAVQTLDAFTDMVNIRVGKP